MAKAASPKPAKAAKKEPVDKGILTTLVAAHISGHGTPPKSLDSFVDLARQIDKAASGDTDGEENDDE
jgi:hypothetical protein